MTYARIDCGFWDDPKIQGLRVELARDYQRLIFRSHERMTDGVLSRRDMAEIMGERWVKKRVKLQVAGLLIEDDQGRFLIPNFLVWQESAESRKARSQAATERKRRQRANEKSRRDNSTRHAVTVEGVTPSSSSSVLSEQNRTTWHERAASSPEPSPVAQAPTPYTDDEVAGMSSKERLAVLMAETPGFRMPGSGIGAAR